MPDKGSILQTIGWLVVFGACAAVPLFLYLGDQDIAYAVTREDNVIENATAAFFLLGALICATSLVLKRRGAFIWVWLILCVLFLGEETSWFQRIFGYSVPFVEAMNSQHEFNIHNLIPVQSGTEGRRYLTESGEFVFSVDKLVQAQTLFRAGFAAYFLIVPLMWLIPAAARLVWRPRQ